MPETPKITTAQALGSLIKSCRDIMRKDKGLSTDIDRLPMLTWIMFLKFLDDLNRSARLRPAWQANGSTLPSNRRIAGVTGRQDPMVSPAML